MSGKSGEDEPTLQTLKGSIKLNEALEEEEDMLLRLGYWQKQEDFMIYLLEHKAEIEAVVSCHLYGMDEENCRLADVEDWMNGSFNMCLPVYVKQKKARSEKRLMLRFPLPYKVGEETFPGNAAEKLRCEAATYAWIQQHCTDVPIPRLLGFSFGGIRCFTSLKNIAWYLQGWEHVTRWLRRLFGYQARCDYVCQQQPHQLDPGYLLTEFIEEEDGRMLAYTWNERRHDKASRANLFKGISRIILSLGRVPLPRIGSFTLNDQGVISLTNRPLSFQLHQLENNGISTTIGRRDTYTTVEPYLHDLLSSHDNRLRHQSNSITDRADCTAQMAALAGMRTVLPHFVQRDLRKGPFLFGLTDLHQGNIFVDDQWNIKYLIDLEWACSQPAEMQNPPFWLNNKGVDTLKGDALKEYDQLRKEFMEIFDAQEQVQEGESPFLGDRQLTRTRIMERAWEVGSVHYFHALESTTGLFNIWVRNIQPRFTKKTYHEDDLNELMAPLWSNDAEHVVNTKLEDRARYDAQVRDMFEHKDDIATPTEEAQIEGQT